MQSSLEIFIQRLLEFAGQNSHGPVTLSWTKRLPSGLTTDITLTASCVRNSAMEAIMEANQQPLPSRPSSPSPSSSDSSQYTFEHSLAILSGNGGWLPNYDVLDALRRSLEESDGFMGGVAIQLRSGRLLLMTRSALL